MAIFYTSDYYQDSDNHLKAMCKISYETQGLQLMDFKTNCGMKLAVCKHGHLHIPKRIGNSWGQHKWRPLPEFCLNWQIQFHRTF